MNHSGTRLCSLLLVSAFLLGGSAISPRARAVSTGSKANSSALESPLEQRAEQMERQGKWADACKAYDELVHADRAIAKYRFRFQYCFRRFLQAQRHDDPSFRKDAVSLSYSQAIGLYETMLKSLQAHHVERAKASPGMLFRQGLEELVNALESPRFRERSFPTVPDSNIRRLQARLQRTWGDKVIASNADAVEQVRAVAIEMQKSLDLDATAVVLEFACGACNALDEYTFYLTPAQYRSLFAAAKGKDVGVGIDLAARDNRMIVARVLRGSPAYLAGIKTEDQIIRIGKVPASDMTPDGAMDLLRGKIGTVIELGVTSDGMFVRPVVLKRQKLAPRSVEFGMLWEMMSMSMERQKTDVGYIQIQNFQETTPRELDAAIQTLKEGGMRALVLDLRGNPGGSFLAAVECARRFLANGVIVIAQNGEAKQDKYVAKAGDSMAVPLLVPLVVLVDGNTASSAEILAGALQDNERAQLVGQTTFGKGCSQKLLTLKINNGKSIAGAIRVTVAKFYSPRGQPYGGAGITPNLPVDRQGDSTSMVDNQLDVARKLAQEALAPMNMPMMRD